MSDYAVSCYTCVTTVWEGDTAPTDGQPILTTYANQSCTRPDCPHRSGSTPEGGNQ